VLETLFLPRQEKRESQLLIIEELEACGHRIKVSVSPERKSAPASAKTAGAPDRLSTLLHATNTNTGRVLRCEVFIDSIARIEILTTARSLYRDDVQEVQVQAFDTQGNIFSSVEGLGAWKISSSLSPHNPANPIRSEFQWGLEPEIAADAGKTILKRMPFKDSGYEASLKLLAFESAGKETSIILLQAMEVGRVKVSAKLAEGSSVPAHTVPMSVIEPLELSPLKELYVAPFTLFTYKLMTYQHRQQKQIDMPNSQYVWSSSDSTIAQVKSDGRVTTSNKLGYSVIKVEHKNMEDSVTKGGINVVQPARLSFRLRPASYRDDLNANTRYLVHERSYLLEVDVYDSENHRMDQFEASMEFDLRIDDQFLRIVKKEAANVWSVVGIKQGVSPVTISLTRVGHPSLGSATPEQQLKTQQNVEVTPPVRINKEKLVLPVAHSYQLVATGGSGTYSWASNATSAVTVNSVGVVSVVLREAPDVPNTSTVFVSDERDPVFNRASLPVTIATLTTISFGNGAREAEMGTDLVLPIVMSHNPSLVFDSCIGLAMSFNLSVSDIFAAASDVVACPESLVGCACVSVLAVKEGQTRLTASVIGTQLVAATPVAAFRPLEVSPQRILVTLESSFDIVVSGGPQPWQYQQVINPVVTLVDPSSSSAVSIVPVFLTSAEESSGASWSFRLTCHSLGAQKVSVAVGNPSSATNPQPFIASRLVSFDCSEPRHVFVSPVIATQVGDEPLEPGVLQIQSTEGQTACSETDTKLKDLHELLVSLGTGSAPVEPFSVLPTRYKLRNSRLVLFQAAVLDESGRVFDNFSSLAVEWRSTNTSLVSLGPTSEIKQVKTHRLARMAEKEGIS
jgi:nuclear pore complex protein Nup210